jgi:hypothetical protein
MEKISAYIYIHVDNFEISFLDRIMSKINCPLLPLNVYMKFVYEFYGVGKCAPD